MQFPDFNPTNQMLVMDNDKIKVVEEPSEDKRIESNMKVTEFVGQHFKDFDLHCDGFKKLISSIEIKFSNGEFSKNPKFVIEVLKVVKMRSWYGCCSNYTANLKQDHDVQLVAIKNSHYGIFDCEKLMQDKTFLKKLLKEQPDKLFNVIELRARTYDPIIAKKIILDEKNTNIDRQSEKEIKMAMIDCFVNGKFSKDEAKFFIENVFNDFSDEELDNSFKVITNDPEMQLCNLDKTEIVKAQDGMAALLSGFVQFLNELNNLLEIRKNK